MMQPGHAKLLFIKPADSSFVLVDEAILKKTYTVISFLINQKKSRLHFIRRMLNLVIFLIMNARNSVAWVCWFGDYHAAVMVLMGKFFGKKVIVFAGGQDAICYPDLKKGVFCNRLRATCVRYAFRNAWYILPNHKSLLYHENFYYSEDGKKDGIFFYVNGFKTPFTVIPNGIAPGNYYRDISIRKEDNRVMTAGTMSSANDFINKGFDLFVTMASLCEDIEFTLVGVSELFIPWIEKSFHVQDIPNLKIICFSKSNILFQEYNRAKVFVQASITEGMPNTLSEAMLCGCIPVGSNVNGIPDAIGETGVIVYRRDVNELVAAVRKALTLNTGELARRHVLENFTLQHREAKILTLFSEILR